MRKILFIFFCFLLVGCGKKDNKKVFDEIKKKNEKLDSYNIKGELSMYNGDNKYTYDVDVKYKKDSLYRVSLVNKVNNHEQIILRNEESVYVLTPSLNKSFKFQSDWPYNNSQVYILDRIIKDIDNDEEKKYEYKDNMHIFTTKVEYSTNNELVSQKVYFDDNKEIKKVEVYNTKEELVMNFKINSYDENCNIDNKIFDLNNNIDTSIKDEKETDNSDLNSNTNKNSNTSSSNSTIDSNNNSNSNENSNSNSNNTSNKMMPSTNKKKTKNVSKEVEDIIYPMYLPENTYLTSQNKLDKDDGQRVILTFGGDKSFTLIEETITVSKELDVDLTFGEPDIIIDTIGSIDDSSINWVSNNIEYSLVSNDLSKDELVSVAKSISSSSITK